MTPTCFCLAVGEKLVSVAFSQYQSGCWLHSYLFSQEISDLDHHDPTHKRDQSKDEDGGNKVASNTIGYPLDGSLDGGWSKDGWGSEGEGR